MSIPLYVLILEDQPDDAALMLRELRRAGFIPRWQRVSNQAEYLAALKQAANPEYRFDIILADYILPQFTGLQALQHLHARALDIPFLVITGSINEEIAVECIKQGAADYLLKNHLHRLGSAVTRALEQRELHAAQQKGETALREAEERYRSIFENAVEGIFQITPDGQLITANPALARMWGYSSTRALMSSLEYGADLYIDPCRWAEFMELMKTKGSVTGFEAQSYRQDGSPIWISGNVRASLDDAGRVLFYEGTVEDITERKQAEQERERLIEELDAYAHMVAHDLKNPLGVIIGMSMWLESNIDTTPVEDIQQTLHLVIRNGRKMNNIINELLLLASTRQPEVAIQPLDMAAIVAEARQRLAHTIEEHCVEIIEPAAWPAALGYGPWVEEVWVNYLSNAIKYGGYPPRLELNAAVQDDGRSCFWVRDNGCGLTHQEQAKLFTPFTRLKKTEANGHGLGLSICRRIVEKLGGEVGVQSDGRPGQGSIFSFTLPGVPTGLTSKWQENGSIARNGHEIQNSALGLHF